MARVRRALHQRRREDDHRGQQDRQLTSTPATAAGQEGSSPITAVFSVAIFLGFLFFAAQILLHLYGASIVTSTAFDAARRVAADDGLTVAEAESRLLGSLGEYGSSVTLDWSQSDAETVVLVVDGPSPANFFAYVSELAGLDSLHREVRVRVEDFRP